MNRPNSCLRCGMTKKEIEDKQFECSDQSGVIYNKHLYNNTMKKKNDWVPCFGEGCKTKINLNGSSIVDSFCMECREGRDTAPEKAHDPTPSQSIMPMKSKCCGAEVCRSHDGRSTFCMKCFADTTESETNHRAQVEDWEEDLWKNPKYYLEEDGRLSTEAVVGLIESLLEAQKARYELELKIADNRYKSNERYREEYMSHLEECNDLKLCPGCNSMRKLKHNCKK